MIEPEATPTGGRFRPAPRTKSSIPPAAPGDAGLFQIVMQVPDGLADGDQPVTMQINGVQSPEVVLINVQN